MKSIFEIILTIGSKTEKIRKKKSTSVMLSDSIIKDVKESKSI